MALIGDAEVILEEAAIQDFKGDYAARSFARETTPNTSIARSGTAL